MGMGHHGAMERDWARFGRAVKAARLAREMTQDDLARAVNVGLSTIQTLERGAREYAKVTATHNAVAKAVGWAEGSVEAVLSGGEPTVVASTGGPALPASPVSPAGEVDDLLDDLTERVRQALLGGKVEDATAIELDSEDQGDVVLIWKRGEQQDLSPEEQRKLRRKWARLQRAAHEILSDDSDTQ